jgi:hypothetical protein
MRNNRFASPSRHRVPAVEQRQGLRGMDVGCGTLTLPPRCGGPLPLPRAGEGFFWYKINAASPSSACGSACESEPRSKRAEGTGWRAQARRVRGAPTAPRSPGRTGLCGGAFGPFRRCVKIVAATGSERPALLPLAGEGGEREPSRMRVRPRKRRNKVSFDLASARTLTLPLARVPPSPACGRGAFAAVIFTPRLRRRIPRTPRAVRSAGRI